MSIKMEYSQRDLVRIFSGIIGIELLLVVAYIIETSIDLPFWNIERLLNLDGDFSIGQWFSSVQLAVIGLLFAIKAFQSRSQLEPTRWFLLLLCLGFLFLSADEALCIHENIGKIIKGVEWTPKYRSRWTMGYGAIGLVLVVTCSRQIARALRNYPQASTYIAVGFGIFLAGAVGLELIAGNFLTTHSMIYTIEVCIEEFMEMAGATMILYGTLLYLNDAQEINSLKPTS